jgi:hypothetical protein
MIVFEKEEWPDWFVMLIGSTAVGKHIWIKTKKSGMGAEGGEPTRVAFNVDADGWDVELYFDDFVTELPSRADEYLLRKRERGWKIYKTGLSNATESVYRHQVARSHTGERATK